MRYRFQPSRAALWTTFFLVVMTGWGFYLRIHNVGSLSFWIDEAVSVSQAKAILAQGTPKEPDGTTDWNAFPANYLVAFGLSLSNEQQFGARLFSVIAGTACIPLIFFLGRRLFQNDHAGLLAAACTAFLYDQIAWSRQARPYITLQFFFLLTCCMILLYVKTRKLRYGASALMASILCMSCHRAGYLAVLTCLSSAFCIALCHIRDMRNSKATWTALAGLLLLPGVFVLASWLSPADQTNLRETLRSFHNPYDTNYWQGYLAQLNEQFGKAWIPLFGIGCLAGVVIRKELAPPLIGSAAVYFVVLSFCNWMYADRYLFPIHSIIVLFAAYGVAFSTRLLVRLVPLNDAARALAVCFAAASVAYFYSAKIVLSPQRELSLGFTAPQPDWHETFALIRRHNAAVGRTDNEIVTISSYPVLHDVYLGLHTGQKYYLPTNFGGHPNGVAETPPHSKAKVVRSLDQLQRLSGYLFVDDLSLRMLGCSEIQEYLLKHKPNAILKGEYNVFVWELRSPSK